MILIGQYDSSFVRRVGIALTLYGLPFEHRPWSTFGDFEKLRTYNPLSRVPTLVLDDGEALIGSLAILDYLDSLAPEADLLLPKTEPERHRALRIVELASGLADKCVSLFYEINFHKKPSEKWSERCRAQIAATLAVLEKEYASKPGPYWAGERLGHADIAVVASMRHCMDAHPDLVRLTDYPALAALCALLEAKPVFQAISQPFIPPAR